VPVLVNAAPVHTFESGILGAVVTVQDISTLKELERMRSEFAAVIAHDLRNPIQVIRMQSQALLRQVEDGHVRVPVQTMKRIERSAERLAGMVDELLDASRADLKQFSLVCEAVDAVALCSEVIERMRPAIGHHPLNLSAEGSLPPVLVDARRFEEILGNLAKAEG
jgi:signal transduction histidine kinase